MCSGAQARRASRPGPRLEQLEARETPARAGLIDPTFATDGVFSPGPDAGLTATAVQPDGKIVAVGWAGTPSDFLILRLNPDGSPDTGFGTGGRATVDFSDLTPGPTNAGYDRAAAVTVMPDGRIVVSGYNPPATSGYALVARLTPAGQPDPTFDTDGRVAIQYGAYGVTLSTYSGGLAVDAAGRVVLVGSVRNGVGSYGEVIRLTAAGQLDPTFDGDGHRTLPGSVNSMDRQAANAVAVQPDGKIVVVGTTIYGDLRHVGFTGGLVIRLNDDGSVDGTFAAGASPLRATAVAVRADGDVVIGGDFATQSLSLPITQGPANFEVVRLHPDGSPDAAFGNTGVAILDLGGDDRVATLAVGADGRVVLGGSSLADFPVVRVNADGTPDVGFNSALGTEAFARFGGSFSATGLAFQGDDIIAAGAGVITRILGEPTLDLPPVLTVSGPPDGSARGYVPDSGGQYGATPAYTLTPFPGFAGGVRTAVADVDGDTIPDTVAVTGPGTPVRVAVVSGADNSTVLVSPFDPFGGDFPGGGFVAAGDFDHDGRAEFVVTPDRGGGPRVSIYSLLATGLTRRANYFTLDPGFLGGVRPAVGDVDGDGTPDLVIAAGFGGGPRVAVIDGAAALTTDGFAPADRLVGDFFAFEPELRNGAYVAIGDVDGDGFGDLVFGAGPGGAPRLLTVSGQQVLTAGAMAAIAAPVSNFFVAGNDTDRGGVRVTTKDADGDNKADVVVGTGENAVSRVRVYLGKDFGGAEPAAFQDLDPFAGAVLAHGVFVG